MADNNNKYKTNPLTKKRFVRRVEVDTTDPLGEFREVTREIIHNPSINLHGEFFGTVIQVVETGQKSEVLRSVVQGDQYIYGQGYVGKAPPISHTEITLYRVRVPEMHSALPEPQSSGDSCRILTHDVFEYKSNNQEVIGVGTIVIVSFYDGGDVWRPHIIKKYGDGPPPFPDDGSSAKEAGSVSGRLKNISPSSGDSIGGGTKASDNTPKATTPAINSGLSLGDDDDFKRVMAPTIALEAGKNFSAINDDKEFDGRIKKDYTGIVHIGLSYGIIQFTQDGGSLGVLLTKFNSADPTEFQRIMGPTYNELLSVTNKTGASGLKQWRNLGSPKQSPEIFGPRVLPVSIDGKKVHIWKEPWRSRFVELGKVKTFQELQLEAAIDLYLRPLKKDMIRWNMISEKSVALVFRISVARGDGGARKWINNKIGDSPEETHENLYKASEVTKDGKKSKSSYRKIEGKSQYKILSSTGKWAGFSKL